MQSFDRDIQSLVFPANKATDQNKFDNCEEYEHLNQTVAETSLIRLILGVITLCMELPWPAFARQTACSYFLIARWL